MRLLLLVAAVVSVSAFATSTAPQTSRRPAQATQKKIVLQPTPGLLSYRQLIRLTPARRIAYIHGVRKLLVELSKMHDGTLVADTSFDYTDESATGEKLIAFLQAIDEVLFPEAEAAANMNCSTDYPVSFGGICGRYMTGSSCGANEQLQGSGSRWFCFSKSDYNQFNPPGQAKRQLKPYQPISATGNAEQLNAAAAQQVRNQQESTRRQMAESQDIANTNQQINIENSDKRLRAQAQDDEETNRQIALQQAARQEASIEQAAVKQSFQQRAQGSVANAIGNENRRVDTLNSGIRQEEGYEQAAKTQADQETLNAAQRQEAGYEESGKKQEVLQQQEAQDRALEKAGKDEEAMRAAQKQDDALGTASAIESGINGSRGLCAEAKLSCQQNQVKTRAYKNAKSGALQKFRSTGPKTCISSGNMSGYKDNVAKAGGCKKVTDFCLDPAECGKTEKGATRAYKDSKGLGKQAGDDEDLKGFKKKYSCDQGKSICNPLVFGLKSKSDAICIKAQGSSLTEDCDKEASRLEKKGGGYVKDFLNEAPRGVAEAWDDYADDFNQTCKQHSESMDAHCEECAKIASRLANEKAMATGSCSDAVDYRRIPSSTGSTTQ